MRKFITMLICSALFFAIGVGFAASNEIKKNERALNDLKVSESVVSHAIDVQDFDQAFGVADQPAVKSAMQLHSNRTSNDHQFKRPAEFAPDYWRSGSKVQFITLQKNDDPANGSDSPERTHVQRE